MCVRDDGDNVGGPMAVCGDGIVSTGEACDDGNAVELDGCKRDCTVALRTYIKASNTGESDRFGASLALSADGSTLAVAAYLESSAATGIGGDQADNSARLSGAVYVFTRSGATWIQQAYVKASNSDAADAFGYGLALSADGSTLAVGAFQEASAAIGVGGDQTDDSAQGAGAVYLFTRSGTTWTQQAYLKASNTDTPDFFGTSLALSADGSTLAVAALQEASAAVGIDGDQTDNSADSAGAVYVFTRSGMTWTQQAYVKASNTGAFDGFGSSLALSADGAILAVGAMGEASAATGVDGDQTDDTADSAGAVYVYRRSGATWAQQSYLKASNAAAFSGFGSSVALSADGATLAVGARGASTGASGIDGPSDRTANGSGAAYVFTRSHETWAEQAYLEASNPDAYDAFGVSVALSADGSTLAVGADQESSATTGIGGDQASNSALFAGAAYLFTRSDTTWTQRVYLKASNTDANDGFGASLALSADGATLAAGAAMESSAASGVDGYQGDNSAKSSGAVYVFH